MNKFGILTLSALVSIGVAATAANADTYSSVTTTDGYPSAVTESRTTTIESAPVVAPTTTVIREQPVIVQPESREVIVEKRHHHHLINVGPVKVF